MLNKDFKEFVELLNSAGVEYLIVGAYALAAHGHPRYTGDIDIWIRRSKDNVTKILKVLEEFGFGSLGLAQEDFSKPDAVIQLGYPPARIDLLTSISKGLDRLLVGSREQTKAMTLRRLRERGEGRDQQRAR